MKVVEIQTCFGIDALRIVDRPEPAPRPDEVVVKVHAASLNYRDLQTVRGEFPALSLPFVPLSDGAGEVVEVGKDVRRFLRGDRVCPSYVLDWVAGPPTPQTVRRRLGSTVTGVLAEYVCVPEHSLVRQPSHLTSLEVACFPIAAVTAWEALATLSDPVADDTTVLVQGTGGVSAFALQLARSRGLRVIVTSRSERKLALARDLGASDTVHVTTRNWAEQILELTAGQGVDLSVNVAGGQTIHQSLSATRLGGTVVLVGYVESSEAKLNVPTALRQMTTIRAMSVGSRSSLEAVLNTFESHALHPVVDSVFPVAEVAAAFEHFESGAHVGKIAISLE